MEILETSDNSNDDSSQSPKLACIVSKEKESGVEKQSSQDQSKFDDKTAAKLIEDEGRETRHVRLKVYKQYFTEAFRWWGITLVVAMSAGLVLSFLAGDYFATSDGSGIPSFTFIFVYAAIAVVACIVLIGRAFMYTYLGLKTSQSFFVGMLQSILRAPMSIFDTTPSGRILSRVSTDILWVDITIPIFTNFVMIAYLSLFSILIVTCQNSWETVFLVIPLVWLYNWHKKYHLATSRELTHLDSITKAPVIHHFSETLSGVMTIRSLRKHNEFCDENIDRVNATLRMDFPLQTCYFYKYLNCV